MRARKRIKANGGDLAGNVLPDSAGFDHGFSWKVREIEHANKTFNESARFFHTTKNRRDHGLKFVPKPVTDTLAELIEEHKATEIKNPNYLQNPRYSLKLGALAAQDLTNGK